MSQRVYGRDMYRAISDNNNAKAAKDFVAKLTNPKIRDEELVRNLGQYLPESVDVDTLGRFSVELIFNFLRANRQPYDTLPDPAQLHFEELARDRNIAHGLDPEGLDND